MGLARLLPRPGTRDDISKGATLGRVIAFANQKGGVAKTTTALNLGVAFAEQGIKVLLVDLDPQGNLTMSQGLNPDAIERSMFDVLVHRVPITEVIHNAEVDLAVSSIDLAGAELALSSIIGRERALENAPAPAEAPVKGSWAHKYDTTGNAAEAYRTLAKEVLNGTAPREHA